MLKAVVFDFDGVIVDSEPLHYRAFLRVAKGFGVEFSYNEYLQTYIGYDDRDAFRVMLGLMPGVEGTPEERAKIGTLTLAKADAFEAVVRGGIEPIAGMVELIHEAAAAGLPIAIASGATRRDIDLILGGLGLAPLFPIIVTADMVARSKPDPETYALASRRVAQARPELEIAPRNCLAIEDTAAGIESARGAGLMTLGITTTGTADKLHLAHRVIPSAKGLRLRQLREWFDD